MREHTDRPFSRDGIPYYADDSTVYSIGSVSAENAQNCYITDLEAGGNYLGQGLVFRN